MRASALALTLTSALVLTGCADLSIPALSGPSALGWPGADTSAGTSSTQPSTQAPATPSPTTQRPVERPTAPATTQAAEPAPETTEPASPSAGAEPPASNTVAAALERIPTKGRAPKTGYERAVVFGPAWKDVDRNGCDTRNDILARDLAVSSYKPGTRDCVVLTGALEDPYTGKHIDFLRGQGTSNAVQIDHVVALSDAWQKGAQKLSQDQREALANDPLNLLAVDGPTNNRKSDGDAATWLPPLKSYRCAYVARQSAVKLKYGLWMTAAEKNAITRVLEACPGQVLPTA